MTRTRLVIRSLYWPVLVAACLFGGAGRFDIPAFQVFVALFAANLIYLGATMDLELAAERHRQKNRRLLLFAFLVHLGFVAAGLDVGRFHWSGPLPWWLQAIAFAVTVACWVLSGWAMRVNSFFSSVIRIQKDRGQRVIDSGPYAVIRHPGYASMIVTSITVPVALGSLAALVPTLPVIPALFVRLLAEEKALRAGLEGYAEYAGRVRWRIAPGVW